MIKVNLYNIKWKSKITQKEIIESTGLGKVTVNKLLSGKYHDFRLSTLDKICKYFDCNISDILEQDKTK